MSDVTAMTATIETSFDKTYDVVVIGGGPAGSTVATLVADAGHKVLVVERTKFPRFHIGESLMPETYWSFERLGMLPKLQGQRLRQEVQRAVRHRQRQGEPAVLLRRARPARVQPDLAGAAQPVRPDAARQRRRARRDGLAGGERQRGAARAERRPTTCPRATGVVVTPQGRARRGASTRRSSSTPPARTRCSRKKLGIRKGDPKLRKASIFAHYKGCAPRPGQERRRDARALDQAERRLVLVHPAARRHHQRRRRRRPRPPGRTSSRTPEQTLDEEIANCPGLADRDDQARRASAPVHVLSDFSYRSTRCAGDGWVLVGDAFGFLDPMYSSGVFLALKSGEMAADAINEAFETSDFSARRSSASGATSSADGMQTIRKLVYAFYTPDFSLRPVRQGVPAAQGRRDGRPRRRRLPAGGRRALQADEHDGADPGEHPAGEAEGASKHFPHETAGDRRPVILSAAKDPSSIAPCPPDPSTSADWNSAVISAPATAVPAPDARGIQILRLRSG